MIFLQPNWILAFVCAFTFYGAGKSEARGGARDNSLPWAGLSIAVSALMIGVFAAGSLLVLLAQGGLFVGIAAFRVWRDKK